MIKKNSKEYLLNKISVLESSRLYNLVYAKTELKVLSESNFMASGIVIEIKDLSGKVRTKFMISDGFKIETISALQLELDKSIKIGTNCLPK